MRWASSAWGCFIHLSPCRQSGMPEAPSGVQDHCQEWMWVGALLPCVLCPNYFLFLIAEIRCRLEGGEEERDKEREKARVGLKIRFLVSQWVRVPARAPKGRSQV